MYVVAVFLILGEVIFRGAGLKSEVLYTRFFALLLGYVFIYAIPVGIWIYRDSGKTLGSTRDEAMGDAGFQGLYRTLAAFPLVYEYFKKRERFLTDEVFRKSFLQQREELRRSLTGKARKKGIYAALVLIIIVYSLLFSR